MSSLIRVCQLLKVTITFSFSACGAREGALQVLAAWLGELGRDAQWRRVVRLGYDLVWTATALARFRSTRSCG
jgi:hypothetical protein